MATFTCGGCDCFPEPPVEAAVEAADAVFVGRVLGVNQVADETNDTRTPAMLLVQEQIKGALPTVVIVTTRLSGVHCGYRFEVGARYLVYASGEVATDGTTYLSTTICTRTSQVEDVEQEEWELLRSSP